MPFHDKNVPLLRSLTIFALLLAVIAATLVVTREDTAHAFPSQQTVTTSRGVAWHGAEAWHNNTPAWNGSGIRVGIIDSGGFGQ